MHTRRSRRWLALPLAGVLALAACGEDDDASDASFESGSRRSLLDDEYLSPAQAKAHDDPVEESDEALDAYMRLNGRDPRIQPREVVAS